jgi:hypothetical protein
MTKYINTLFAIMFVALCFSCNDRTLNNFEVPGGQDQQVINDNTNLDKFVDDVKPYVDDNNNNNNNNTETQKAVFYNDNNAPSAETPPQAVK